MLLEVDPLYKATTKLMSGSSGKGTRRCKGDLGSNPSKNRYYINVKKKITPYQFFKKQNMHLYLFDDESSKTTMNLSFLLGRAPIVYKLFSPS